MNPWTRNTLILGLAIGLLVGGYWWSNRGYGSVSPRTYEFSKAVYSACLKQSATHLDKVEQMLNDSEGETLPERERRWLEQMVERARRGEWQRAAQQAKRMMEDQVQY